MFVCFWLKQGEVEAISLMKPKGEDGLLEYLEDIIGSNKHLEAIDKLNAQLDEANLQRERVATQVCLFIFVLVSFVFYFCF